MNFLFVQLVMCMYRHNTRCLVVQNNIFSPKQNRFSKYIVKWRYEGAFEVVNIDQTNLNTEKTSRVKSFRFMHKYMILVLFEHEK